MQTRGDRLAGARGAVGCSPWDDGTVDLSNKKAVEVALGVSSLEPGEREAMRLYPNEFGITATLERYDDQIVLVDSESKPSEIWYGRVTEEHLQSIQVDAETQRPIKFVGDYAYWCQEIKAGVWQITAVRIRSNDEVD